MAITFPCVRCGKTVKAPDAARGRQVKCPGCKKRQTVPKQTSAADAEESPPAREATEPNPKATLRPSNAEPLFEPAAGQPPHPVEDPGESQVHAVTKRAIPPRVPEARPLDEPTLAALLEQSDRMRRRVVIVRSLAIVLAGGLLGFAFIALLDQRWLPLVMILLALGVAVGGAWLLGEMQATLEQLIDHHRGRAEAEAKDKTHEADEHLEPSEDDTTA